MQEVSYTIGWKHLFDRHRQRTELYYRYRSAEAFGMLPQPGDRMSTTQVLLLMNYWTIRRWEKENAQ